MKEELTVLTLLGRNFCNQWECFCTIHSNKICFIKYLTRLQGIKYIRKKSRIQIHSLSKNDSTNKSSAVLATFFRGLFRDLGIKFLIIGEDCKNNLIIMSSKFSFKEKR